MAERKAALELARGLDEVDRVVVVLLDAGGDGEDVRVEDDVLGREADLLGQQPVGARADLDLALDGVGLAVLVEGHHHHGRAVAAHQRAPGRRNSASPSFIEIELTMPLPCRHFRPASITLNFELSTITGTRAMSGSAAIRLRKRDHRLLGIEQALVHVDVDDLRAVLDLLARDDHRFVVAVFHDQLLELRRAGDVGALADVDEVAFRA